VSAASGMRVAYGRLDVFSNLAEKARRATLDGDERNLDVLSKLLRLLEQQERATASLDALEFQTLLKTRCSVSSYELDFLRQELQLGRPGAGTIDLLGRIATALARERSALANRISGG
tara:strand:+ start:3501 stop:3854 length:354 start_codon:yes stop_codon:yes gene_type:complete